MLPNRRNLLLAGTAMGLAQSTIATAQVEKSITKKQVKQSLCAWCYTSGDFQLTLDQLCEFAAVQGCTSIELVSSKEFATLKKYGLTCAISSNGFAGSFRAGFNNLKHQEALIARTQKAIDEAAEFGCQRVIAFVGMKWNDYNDPTSGEIPRDVALTNCVRGLKKIVGYAEKKKVTLCLEHLNTRDGSHPMKGHPGYQGDDLDFVCSIIRSVDSPALKLLFDVYHVQIMHGDILRRLRECADILGHIHTAGVPDRAELDERQELNYPTIMRELLKLKYTGFVGHEYIPTREVKKGLQEAMKLCDV